MTSKKTRLLRPPYSTGPTGTGQVIVSVQVAFIGYGVPPLISLPFMSKGSLNQSLIEKVRVQVYSQFETIPQVQSPVAVHTPSLKNVLRPTAKRDGTHVTSVVVVSVKLGTVTYLSFLF